MVTLDAAIEAPEPLRLKLSLEQTVHCGIMRGVGTSVPSSREGRENGTILMIVLLFRAASLAACNMAAAAAVAALTVCTQKKDVRIKDVRIKDVRIKDVQDQRCHKDVTKMT